MNIGMWIGIGICIFAVLAGGAILWNDHDGGDEAWGDIFIVAFFGALLVVGLIVLGISAGVAYANPVYPPGYRTMVLNQESAAIAKIKASNLSGSDKAHEIAATESDAWVAYGYVSASPFAGCPRYGDSKLARIRQLDVIKNRSTAPSNIDSSVTLKAMLAGGNDVHRWSDNEGARITGFVIEVKPGGLESVNCHAHTLARRDTHIELALKPDGKSTQAVIVEVTPYWRSEEKQAGKNWSTKTLRHDLLGHRVQITGWLFLDAEHENAAENTRPGKAHDWRGTAWEIHPVTGIKVLSGSGGRQ